jgi:ATP-dependent Clp protease ATP-binding subunit ClpB
VEPAHLLVALLADPQGTARALLRAVGADPADVERRAEALLGALPKASGSAVQGPTMSRPLLQVLQAAQERAGAMGDEYVSTEHLLTALASIASPVRKLLTDIGAGEDALLAAFTHVRGSARVTGPDPEDTYQALEKFGVDLTARAREGGLDPWSAGTRRSAGRPGAVAADEEQPGADRRARCRQDRGGRGPGPAHHRR